MYKESLKLQLSIGLSQAGVKSNSDDLSQREDVHLHSEGAKARSGRVLDCYRPPFSIL